MNKRYFRYLSLLVIVLLLSTAFSQTLAQEAEVIKIYTSWPLQGAMLPEGTSMVNAAQLAIDHYYEDHDGQGPAGFEIELVVNDDASPTTGSWDGVIEAENAQRCINDPQCMVYFGTYNSGAAKISMPLTNEAGIAQITPANTYPGLTKPWDEGEPEIYRPSGDVNYFRTHAADDLQGYSGAAWAQCLGFTKVYVLDDRQLYGKGIADAFVLHAEEIGLEVVGHDGVESTDIDFRTLLTKVRASGADLVYGGMLMDSGGPQVIQQMFDLGLFEQGVSFMGPDALSNTVLAEQVGGPEVGSGQIYTTFPGLAASQLTSENGVRFVEDYVELYGEEPIGWAVYAYQSMQVILHSIEVAGEADRGAILEAMRGLEDFDGIAGTFSFNENGDPTFTTLGGYLLEDGELNFVTEINPEMFNECP